MQRIAFGLIGIGVLVIIGYLVRGFFTSPFIPLAFKVAAVAIVLGFVLLISSVIRERYQSAKKEEDLKEIKR
jgi:undecaprenyl pyrophosphate phosphatase UppP